MEIKSLAQTNFNVIFTAFEKAFADYELQQNKEQLRIMLQRRGFRPELSFAAFEENEIVSFTLNGIGNFNGKYTAYDTGTGTIQEYRGKGLATKIFEYSIPYLKATGIGQYLLEVLQHNTKAVSVYSKLGFEVTREFYYFSQRNEHIHNELKKTDNVYSIREIDIENFPFIPEFWDFYPSWQNNLESIQRAKQGFLCFGAFTGTKLIGYCVFEPVSGDITQIAVDKHHRRKGIASLLLQEMLRRNKNDRLKAVNTDVLCDPVTGFLKSRNIELNGKQFEMIRKL